MRGGRRRASCAGRLLAAVIAALAATGPATSAANAAVEDLIQDDAALLYGGDAQVSAALARIRALGFDRVRLTASWSQIAPAPAASARPAFDARDPGAYPPGAWAGLDRAIVLAGAAGLRAMVDIAFWAPLWAAEGPSDPRGRHRTRIDPREYAAFAEAVARRYSGSYIPVGDRPLGATSAAAAGAPGSRAAGGGDASGGRAADAGSPAAVAPLPAVDVFTLWNEPNQAGFLLPQWRPAGAGWAAESPHLYRAMVRAAYPAVKAVAPASRVLIGGTASSGSSAPGRAGVPPLRFLRVLACVDDLVRPINSGGCAGFTTVPGDGWSHHPYSLRTTPDVDSRDPDKLPVAATRRLATTLRRLVELGRLAPGNAELWLTEYGYETRPPDARAFGADAQGELLAWAESIATGEPAVRSWPQFLLRDLPDAVGPDGRPLAEWQTGLLFADGSEKPAAADYQLPVAVTCVLRRDRRWASVWGRWRTAPGAAGAGLEVQPPGQAWQQLAGVARPGGPLQPTPAPIAAGEPLRIYVPHVDGARYRLRWSAGGVEAVSSARGPLGGCAAAA